MISDLTILAVADRIKVSGTSIATRLRTAIVAAKTIKTLPDDDSVLKAAVIATLRASEASDPKGCAALISELDVLFGATAVRANQPLTLATVLSAFPNGKFPIGVLSIWTEVL